MSPEGRKFVPFLRAYGHIRFLVQTLYFDEKKKTSIGTSAVVFQSSHQCDETLKLCNSFLIHDV